MNQIYMHRRQADNSSVEKEPLNIPNFWDGLFSGHEVKVLDYDLGGPGTEATLTTISALVVVLQLLGKSGYSCCVKLKLYQFEEFHARSYGYPGRVWNCGTQNTIPIL